MTAVTNATPCIYLAKLGRLDTLRDCFEEVVIPEPVYEEVVVEGRDAGYPDAIIVEKACEEWLERRSVTDKDRERVSDLQNSADLGRGETAVIVLGDRIDATRCLIDDHAARQTARALGIPVGGTIFVLLESLKRDSLSLEEYQQAINDLHQVGFRMSAELYRRAMDAGRDIAT